MQLPITHAVIMAAGKGMRMRPLTLTCPKPMVEIAGQPILAYTINELPESVTDVVLIVGYLQEVIRDYFGDTWRGRRITYVEQTELSGTGAAIHLVQPYVSGSFLVLNGDDLYCREDMEKMCGVEGVAILAMPMDEPGRFSPLVVDDQNRLQGLQGDSEQDSGRALINTGMYLLNEKYFAWPLVAIAGGVEFGLPHTIAAQCADEVVTVCSASFWYPIGFPEDIEGAAAALLGRKNSV